MATSSIVTNDVAPRPLPSVESNRDDSETVNQHNAEEETVANQTTTSTSPDDSPTKPSTVKRKWTTNRANLVLAVIVFSFAVAAYVSQLQGNKIGQEANQIARTTYNEQLWKDCQDRPDIRDTKTCKNLLNAPFDEILSPSRLKPRDLTRLAGIRFSAFIDGQSSKSELAILTHPNVFVVMVLAHIMFLFPLRDLASVVSLRSARRARTSTTPRTQEEVNGHSDCPTAAEYCIAGLALVVWLMAILIAINSLQSGLTGDLACTYALILLLSSMIVFEPAINRLRLTSFPVADYPLSATFSNKRPHRRSVVELAGDMIFWVCRKIQFKPWKRN